MDTIDGGTTDKNWFEREGNAIKSMCFGFLMVIVVCIVIFMNEMHLVLSQATADLIAKATVVGAPDEANNGKLIFTNGYVNAPDIADNFPDQVQPFVNHFEGASISWRVQIYQWEESSEEKCTKTRTGGETCHTTYSYKETWSSDPIDSSRFYSESSHYNDGVLPANLADGDFVVEPYSISLSKKKSQEPAYVLDASLQAQIPLSNVPLKNPSGVKQDSWRKDGDLTAGMLHIAGGYLGTYHGSPSIGDLRISIIGRSTKTASIVAKQESLDDAGVGLNLPPTDVTTENWPSEKFDIWGRETYPFEYLRDGLMTKEDFQARIKAENALLAWIVRIVCFFVMIMAFNCIFQPLSVAADLLKLLDFVTCCLGSILDSATQMVISTVSCASACFCFTLVFTVAWLYANPTTAVFGLLIIGALVAAGCYFGQQAKAKKAEARVVAVQDYVRLGGEDQQYLVVV